jgi:hypothetical protein
MEDRHVSLSDDEVRERFSAFHDGELSPDEAKVVRGRLAESPQLAAEFEAFERVMGGLASLASHGSHDGAAPTARTPSPPDPKPAAEASVKSGKEPSATPSSDESGRSSVLPEDEAVDLLPDLQKTIHKRSGGKFYKTRASRVIGTRPIEVVAAVTLVLLVLVYVMMSYVSGLRPAEAPPSGAVQTGR